MAGERQLAPLRENPQVIEREITNGFAYRSAFGNYRSVQIQPKGWENYLSLQIHLGEMEQVTNGLDNQGKSELQALNRWKRGIAALGVEDHLRFYSLKGLTSALKTYRANEAERQRRILQEQSPSRTRVEDSPVNLFKETVPYSIQLDRGPFGTFSKHLYPPKKGRGFIEEYVANTYTIIVPMGSSDVSLSFNRGFYGGRVAVQIRVAGEDPVKLTFIADPERLVPTFSRTLSESEGPIHSTSQFFTIQPQGKDKKGPKVKVYRTDVSWRKIISSVAANGMSRDEMVQAISGYKPEKSRG